jgi:hypothetical protein
MTTAPTDDGPHGLTGEGILHASIVFIASLLAALPLSMWAYAQLPPMSLPTIVGLGMDRLLLFLAIFLAVLLLFRSARLLVYGALILGLAAVTITSLMGSYGLHDLYTDYGRMLRTLGNSTQALPKVNEPLPFAREDEVRAAIDFRDPVVRSFAVRAATTWFREEAEVGDDFTLVQAFSIFKVINSSWVYVSDPSDDEYFAKASESVPLLAGDCDDHAVLMAASIKAIGGDVRLVRTTGHIYPEMNVGDAQGMQHAAYLIRNVLFPQEAGHAALYYHTDAKGDRWINLDYTRHYPGGEVMNEKIVGILHV